MTPDHYHDRAVCLYDAQRFREAAEQARAGLRHYPDDGRLWQLYGTACYNLQEYSEARQALEHATALAPLHPLAQLALARCHARAGEDDLARTIYEHLVHSGLCPTALLPAVAVGLNELGAYDLALAACRELTERDPAHHQGHFGTAYYLARLGAPAAELVPPLALAFDLAPHILHYRLNLAFALADAGRSDEAYAVASAVHPEDVRCRCWLARLAKLFRQAGDGARAGECLRRLRQEGAADGSDS